MCNQTRKTIILFFSLFAFALHSQTNYLNSVLSVNFENLNFESAKKTLEGRLGVYFQYDPSILPKSKVYSIKLYNTKGRTIVNEFLNQAGLGFVEKGNNLILFVQTKQTLATPVKEIYRLSGYVTQSVDGEFLGSAVIRIIPQIGTNVYANSAGYFSIVLSKDTNVVSISYPGFSSILDTLIADRNYQINYQLKLKDTGTTINISKKQYDAFLVGRDNLEGESDKHYISKNKTQWLPSMLGEADIMKAISLYPGVVNGSEGLLGIYVRGGDANQNLVLLDEVPIFNSYHLYGIFSIFNDEILKSAELMKGSFPARYGGRLSSVISIQSKEGDNYKFKGSANIGLLSSKIFLEGPIIKGRTTFVASFRRSYLDFLTTPLARFFLFNDSLENNIYYFWDVNARITHKFSQKSRLSVSFYRGNDKAGLFEKTTIDNNVTRITEQRSQLSGWGNAAYSIKWVYQFSKKSILTLRSHYSQFNYSFNQSYKFKKDYVNLTSSDIDDYTQYNLKNGISDLEAGAILENYTRRKNRTAMGFGVTQHHFIPGNRSLLSKIDKIETNFTYNDLTVNNNEIFVFYENDFKIGNKLFVNSGLRDQLYLLKDKEYYHLPEYRLGIKYKVNPLTWLRIGANRNWQFFHLLNNLTLGLPSDLWVPSTKRFSPSKTDQISMGLTRNFKHWQLGSEVFYKKMFNLLEYKDNAGYLTSAINWEDVVTQGKGLAYGWELYCEKSLGRLNGWFSYTLMWNRRKFNDLNQGEYFPYRYDRRHSIYTTLIYTINKRITFSMNWIYNSGFAVTLPIGKYASPTPTDPYRDIFIYGNRNNARVRDNHRLDISFNFIKEKKNYKRVFSIGLFNAYNRKNPFYLRFGYDKVGQRKLYQVSLLPILPNISYKVSI